MEHVSIAKEALIAQSEAIRKMADELDDNFQKAVNKILSSEGRVIISGMGKSGLIGRKIAATFASTGTPSFFMHPAEAYHGDLGMITANDIILLLSYSGETDEVIKLIPILKNFGNTIISIAGNKSSTLAKNSDIYLDAKIEREICPNNLAPTTSTLATMAMGDALAVSLIQARGFEAMDFARFHPGGSLGRKLLTRVRDVMHTVVPTVEREASLHECLMAMTASRVGMAVVMQGDNLEGIITDGDIRRGLVKENDASLVTASHLMSTKPVVVDDEMLLADAEKIMHERKIRVLLVHSAGSNKIKGIVEIFD